MINIVVAAIAAICLDSDCFDYYTNCILNKKPKSKIEVERDAQRCTQELEKNGNPYLTNQD